MNRQHGRTRSKGRCVSGTCLLLVPIEPRRRPIAAVLAACVFLWANAAGAVPTVTETGSAITVDNGLLSFRVDKSDGSVDSLKLGGQELLGGGGILYQDANDGAYWRLGNTTPASYAVTTGADYADVSLSTSLSVCLTAGSRTQSTHRQR